MSSVGEIESNAAGQGKGAESAPPSTTEKLAGFRLDIRRLCMVGDRKCIEGSESQEEKTSIVEDRKERARLFMAALHGDWKTAEAIYEVSGYDIITAIISKYRLTALHIAAAAGRSDFARHLVEKKIFDLTKENIEGNTAFCLVAASGMVEVADAMIQQYMVENKDSENSEASKGKSPLYLAAVYGRKDMVEYLYNDKQGQLNDTELLLYLIKNGLYETALKLLENNKGLGKTHFAEQGETALHVLAKIPIENQQGIWKHLKPVLITLRNQCFKLCGKRLQKSLKELREQCFKLFPCLRYKFGPNRLPPAPEALVKKLWESVIECSSDSDISRLISKPKPLLSVAAKHGNIGFINILINACPDLIFEEDENNHTIFHYAVKYRRNDIFKLIYEIGSCKDFILPNQDKEGNNILHLAGKLPPEDRLNNVSGAALQMQQELLWFEAVEELMSPMDAEAENKKRITPRTLFTRSHKGLKEKGENWMKSTASSCMIVATLIATVVFAAAFAVPGGTNETTGTPNFLHELPFTVFVIADAISLVSSSCSVLTFLTLLTFRYTEDAFIFWLPTMLLFGLVTLLISIGSMMSVFCATYFIVFTKGELSHAVVVSGVASLPLLVFLCHQLPLFVDLVRSTFFSFALFQPALFRRSKLTLSDKIWEEKSLRKAGPSMCLKTRAEV